MIQWWLAESLKMCAPHIIGALEQTSDRPKKNGSTTSENGAKI